MGDGGSPLDEKWGHFRFLGKSVVVFSAVLGGVELIKDFSQPVDQAREAMYAVWWGLPLLFLAWLPLHLIAHLVAHQHRMELEKERKRTIKPQKRRFEAPPRRRR